MAPISSVSLSVAECFRRETRTNSERERVKEMCCVEVGGKAYVNTSHV